MVTHSYQWSKIMMVNIFFQALVKKSDRRASAEITKQLQRDSEHISNDTKCFDGMFCLQLKSDSKPYQESLRCIAYVLQKLFKEELERWQQQGIITPLGIDKTAEWCNSFVFLPKPNGKVRLCLDPARLNQVLNNIFPKSTNVQFLYLIDASSGYHNLKLDDRSSYLTSFVC